MKKFTAIGVMTLLVTTCSVPAAAEPREVQAAPQANSVGLVEWLVEHREAQTLLEEQAAEAAAIKAAKLAEQQQLRSNTVTLNAVIEQLTDRAGKTRYVFSGSTPQGWDCSGLVKWAYGELGVPLEHRASKQQHIGQQVDVPKLGDIVVFKYNNRENAYHVGIYLYPDTMVHAGGQRGDTTSIVSISNFAGKHSEVTYRRLLDTN